METSGSFELRGIEQCVNLFLHERLSQTQRKSCSFPGILTVIAFVFLAADWRLARFALGESACCASQFQQSHGSHFRNQNYHEMQKSKICLLISVINLASVYLMRNVTLFRYYEIYEKRLAATHAMRPRTFSVFLAHISSSPIVHKQAAFSDLVPPLMYHGKDSDPGEVAAMI